MSEQQEPGGVPRADARDALSHRRLALELAEVAAALAAADAVTDGDIAVLRAQVELLAAWVDAP